MWESDEYKVSRQLVLTINPSGSPIISSLLKKIDMFESNDLNSQSLVFSVTKREIEVLNLISYGLSTHDIATNLYISFETVKSHRKNLLQKIGARNVAALVRRGLEYGLI